MMPMRTVAAVALLAVLSGCSIPKRPHEAYYLAKGKTMEVALSPAAGRAVVAVDRGRLDVIFRGRGLHLRATVEAGARRGTMEPGAVDTIVVTALAPTIFTVQTE
jgi:hypothetical protein